MLNERPVDPAVRLLRAIRMAEALAALRSVQPRGAIASAAAACGVDEGQLGIALAVKFLGQQKAQAALAAEGRARAARLAPAAPEDE